MNQYSANYYQKGKISEATKIQISNIISTNLQNKQKEKIKEKTPEKILTEMKAKMDTASEMYKTLEEFEQKLNSLIEKHQNKKKKDKNQE